MMFRRIQQKLRQYLRKRAARRAGASLREFVYLDDVSVYSLLGSRLGPIASEFTDTEQRSLQDELSASLGANVGIIRTEASATASDAFTKTSQVLRRSTVQTTFKELYELERERLALRPLTDEPIASSAPDLATLQAGGALIAPDSLRRGQLVEVEVELEAETVFKVSAIASALVSIVQKNPERFGPDVRRGLREIEEFKFILENLLVGLVPVRGRLLDYCAVMLGGKEWLMPKQALDESTARTALPVYLVGVCEQRLFWKDIRRVLFSELRFRAFCRLAQDGLRKTWAPVKLAEVLDAVVPDLGKKVDLAGKTALSLMARGADQERLAAHRSECIRKALTEYARLLVGHHAPDHLNQGWSPESVVGPAVPAFGSLDDRRRAFRGIREGLEASLDFKAELIASAECRTAALGIAGLAYDGNVMDLLQVGSGPSEPEANERFLDAELIAVYW